MTKLMRLFFLVIVAALVSGCAATAELSRLEKDATWNQQFSRAQMIKYLIMAVEDRSGRTVYYWHEDTQKMIIGFRYSDAIVYTLRSDDGNFTSPKLLCETCLWEYNADPIAWMGANGWDNARLSNFPQIESDIMNLGLYEAMGKNVTLGYMALKLTSGFFEFFGVE